MNEETCKYVYHYDGGDMWYHTSCHHDVGIDLGANNREDWTYCPFCGKKIEDKDE